VTSKNILDLMIAVGYSGLFLFMGKFLRVKIKLFQKLYLPSALIGGFLALAFGTYGFNIIPEDIMKTWAALPGNLINIVFACIFLGATVPKPKDIWKKGGSQLTYSWFIDSMQWILGIGLVAYVIGPIWKIPAYVGSIIEIGWSGGHGTAGGMIEVFRQLGFPDAGDLGMTSATIGLIFGVIIGMVLINIAVRKGYTSVLKSTADIKSENQSGIVPKGQAKPVAMGTVSTFSIEPLALHLALVLISVIIGQYMLKGLSLITPVLKSVPLFPLAMIGGLLIQVFAKLIKADYIIDKGNVDRIQNTALDFLVLTAIATIQIPVVIKYFIPLMILMVSVAVVMVLITMYVAPKMLPNDWFERGIAEFGALSGVLAIGLLLLRVADPEFKTSAPEAFAYERPFFSPFVGGGLVTAIMPLMIANMGPGPVLLIWIGVAVFCLVIAKLSGWLNFSRPKLSPSKTVFK